MHGTLFIGISVQNAKTSLAARKSACEYLDEEGFTPIREFGGEADYYQVGGSCSGLLTLLRLRGSQPEHFEKFMRQYHKAKDPDRAKAVFRKWYPEYKGRIPVGRENVPALGYPDDSMLIDQSLYDQLQEGFSTEFYHSWGLEEKPCALYRDWEMDRQWPEDPGEIIGKIWIVVIDYHF